MKKNTAIAALELAEGIRALLEEFQVDTGFTRHPGHGEDGVHRRQVVVTERHRVQGRGLLHQLVAALMPGASTADGGRRPGPGSRQPSAAAVSAVLQEIEEEAERLRAQMRHALGRVPVPAGPLASTLHEVNTLAHHLGRDRLPEAADLVGRWVHLAVLALGYIAPQAVLRDVPCPDCRTPLCVRSDASSDVWCPNPGCRDEHGRGRRWARAEWPFLLERLSARPNR